MIKKLHHLAYCNLEFGCDDGSVFTLQYELILAFPVSSKFIFGFNTKLKLCSVERNYEKQEFLLNPTNDGNLN